MKRIYLIIILILIVAGYLFFSKFKIVSTTVVKPVATITPTIVAKQLCPRTNPYKNAPEFERGISLLYQRIEENPEAPYVPTQERKTMNMLLQIRNCLDIQFKNIDSKNAEGYFVFDPDSSIDDLRIFVDNKYKGYDDALTALLLSHEVTHAVQLVDYKVNNNSLSCVDKEVNAIKMELQLVRFFNDEEKQSLSSRVQSEEQRTQRENGMPKFPSDPALYGIKELFGINTTVGPMCNIPNTGDTESWMAKDEECREKATTNYITQLVKNNPDYQKECNL